MKNTMKKIKDIFKVLKYVVFWVFYMMFYNLLDLKIFLGSCRGPT